MLLTCFCPSAMIITEQMKKKNQFWSVFKTVEAFHSVTKAGGQFYKNRISSPSTFPWRKSLLNCNVWRLFTLVSLVLQAQQTCTNEVKMEFLPFTADCATWGMKQTDMYGCVAQDLWTERLFRPNTTEKHWQAQIFLPVVWMCQAASGLISWW